MDSQERAAFGSPVPVLALPLAALTSRIASRKHVRALHQAIYEEAPAKMDCDQGFPIKGVTAGSVTPQSPYHNRDQLADFFGALWRS
jgi:hypothetical protein